MNILRLFKNIEEDRLRAGYRIFIFLGLFVPIVVIVQLASLPYSLNYLFISLFLTLLIWGVGSSIDKRKLAGFGLHLSPKWWREFFIGTALATVVTVVLYVFAILSGSLHFDGFGWEIAGWQTFAKNAFFLLLMMLCIGYYEELLFRGYFNLNLFEGIHSGGSTRSWVSGIASVIFISLAFALAHANNPNATTMGIVNVFLAGVMLGIPVLATGRLGLSVGLHFAWNYIQGPILGMPVSGINFNYAVFVSINEGEVLWSGGAFGFEGGLFGLFGILMISAAMYIYLKKNNYLNSVHPAILSQVPAIKSKVSG